MGRRDEDKYAYVYLPVENVKKATDEVIERIKQKQQEELDKGVRNKCVKPVRNIFGKIIYYEYLSYEEGYKLLDDFDMLAVNICGRQKRICEQISQLCDAAIKEGKTEIFISSEAFEEFSHRYKSNDDNE